MDEAEENNLGAKVLNARWNRWCKCSLCEQRYHGVVFCALGWACWKTYLGRPETDQLHGMAMSMLGSGLSEAEHHDDALSIREARLAMMRRLDADEENLLVTLNNLASTYADLGHLEKALSMERDVYSGRLKLQGEENERTLRAANNYAYSLFSLQHFEEANALLRKTIPVARRVLGEGHELTLKMRQGYARALYENEAATVDDLREAVTTLEDTARTARRVFGGAHPIVVRMETSLRNARATLRAREPRV